jgi:hypothetical protein
MKLFFYIFQLIILFIITILHPCVLSIGITVFVFICTLTDNKGKIFRFSKIAGSIVLFGCLFLGIWINSQMPWNVQPWMSAVSRVILG